MAMRVYNKRHTVQFRTYVAQKVCQRRLSGGSFLKMCPSVTKHQLQRWCEAYRLFGAAIDC